MMKKCLFMVLGLFLLGIISLSAQQADNPKKPIDTLQNKKAFRLIQSILAKDTTDTLYRHISIFGNPDCYRCYEVEKALRDNKLSFDLYDLRDNDLLMLVHKMIVNKEKTASVAYNYPIIIYKGEVTYSIKDVNVFVEEMKRKFSP